VLYSMVPSQKQSAFPSTDNPCKWLVKKGERRRGMRLSWEYVFSRNDLIEQNDKRRTNQHLIIARTLFSVSLGVCTSRLETRIKESTVSVK